MGLPEPSSPPAGSLCTPDARDRPWSPLTFNPPQLTVAEGDTATFTCSFSNKSDHFVLNWYRMSPQNQTHKLAAFPEDSPQPSRDGRFRVTQLPNGHDFRMSILATQRNDSGIYLCGAINLFPETRINESPSAELTVTGAGGAPAAPGPCPAPGPLWREARIPRGTPGVHTWAQGEGGGPSGLGEEEVGPRLPVPVSPSLTLCPFASPERVLETPTERPSPQPRSSGQVQGLVIGVTSVLVGVLLLLLLTWVLASAFPRATRGNAPASPTAVPPEQSPRRCSPCPPDTPRPSSTAPHCPHSEHPPCRGALALPGPGVPTEAPAMPQPPCLLSGGA